MNYEELNKLSVQEACDFAVSQLVDQKLRCVGYTGCAYKIGYRRCAIGWLIADEEIERWENASESVEEVLRVLSLKANFFDAAPTQFWTNFQDFHDSTDRIQRKWFLKDLEDVIDTSAPQYQEWVDIGDE